MVCCVGQAVHSCYSMYINAHSPVRVTEVLEATVCSSVQLTVLQASFAAALQVT